MFYFRNDHMPPFHFGNRHAVLMLTNGNKNKNSHLDPETLAVGFRLGL
jgi:hypothetical protein